MSLEESTQRAPGLSKDHTSLTRAEVAVGSLSRHQLSRSNPTMSMDRDSFMSSYTPATEPQPVSAPVLPITNDISTPVQVSPEDEAFLQSQLPKLMIKPEPQEFTNQFNDETKIQPNPSQSDPRERKEYFHQGFDDLWCR